MKKYLYNLCVCVFGMAFVFQADEAFGMNNSRSNRQSTAQRGKPHNSSQQYTKNSKRTSNNKSMKNNEEDEFEDKKQSKIKKPTLAELKECPCVQEYIELTKVEDEEDYEDEPMKKKLKKRDDKNFEEDEEGDKRTTTRNNGTKKNNSKPKSSRNNKADESWKYTDASYSFEKYKMIPLFNKQYTISDINLAENSVSVDAIYDKNINIHNDENPDKENKDLNPNQKYKYRIDHKESIKFRQDLEKYRQTYA